MKRVVLVLLIAVLAAGCGPADQPVPEATPSVTVGDTPVVPGMPAGLCVGDCVATDFDVWQDFMPGNTPDSAPLHAGFTLAITWPNKITPGNTHGTITLLRASGQEIVTGDIQLNQQGDDLGLL